MSRFCKLANHNSDENNIVFVFNIALFADINNVNCCDINQCAAKLLVYIFSFKARIADAISCFKWRNKSVLLKNRNL